MSETAVCSDAVIRVMDASDWMAEILNKVQIDSADATRLSIIREYMHKELGGLLELMVHEPGKSGRACGIDGQEG